MAGVSLSNAVWGIYDAVTLQEVFDYDSFLSFKIEDTSKVSDFPTEEGAFATYNKVSKAYKAEIQLAVSDTPARRTAFLSKLADVRKSISTMHLVTQDYIYLNATLEDYTTARVTKGGVGRVVARLNFVEVRTVASQYGVAKVRSAGAAKVVNTGTVGTMAPEVVALTNFWRVSQGYSALPGGTLTVQKVREATNGFAQVQGVSPPSGFAAIMGAATPSSAPPASTPATH